MSEDNIVRPDFRGGLPGPYSETGMSEAERRLDERARAEAQAGQADTGHTEKGAEGPADPPPFGMTKPVAAGVFVYMGEDGKFGMHMHQIADVGTALMLVARANANLQARVTAEALLRMMAAAQ